MSTADADARAVEEMADSMLWDSPIPETEEEKKRQEEVLTGKPVVPSPLGLDSPLIRLFARNFFLDPQNQEDPVGSACQCLPPNLLRDTLSSRVCR